VAITVRAASADRRGAGRLGPALDAARSGNYGGDRRPAGAHHDALTPITPEFWGKAKAARAHFTASAVVSPLMSSIYAHARAECAAKPRHGATTRTLAFVQQRWRRLPPSGCILQTFTPMGSAGIDIRDVRGSASTYSHASWGDDGEEQGLCLVDCRLFLHLGIVRETRIASPVTSSLSLHSLARWFARQASGEASGLEALRRDMAILAREAPMLLAKHRPGVSVRIATAGGDWRGYVAVNADGGVWVDIRTFC
jgi:hypothetical protein